MKITALLKLTLLDYPGKTAATVFTPGCNFRCPFCHNASLVLGGGGPSVPEEEVLAFLEKRRGLLDGLCVTGGEPTLHPELPDFLARVKALGYSVKLDTNGTSPKVLGALISSGLIDSVAMDIKSSKARYPAVAGAEGIDVSVIAESASLLMGGAVDFEFRTTVVEELHSEDDFTDIGRWLEGGERYFLQCFRDSGDIISDGLTAPSEDKLRRCLDRLREYIPNAELRGV